MPLKNKLKYIDQNEALLLEYLIDFLKIKSVSTDPTFSHHCEAAANWLVSQLLNLGFEVKGKPLDKKVGDQAIVNFKERDSLLKTLSMSYYANTLGVYFNVECILAHSFNYYRRTL